MGGSRGGTGGSGSLPPPPKNHKNIGFPSNIDPDPLNITTLPSQHSMVGHYRHASETPFLAGWWWPTFSGISILSPSHQLKKKKRQCWTPSDKTFSIRACINSSLVQPDQGIVHVEPKFPRDGSMIRTVPTEYSAMMIYDRVIDKGSFSFHGLVLPRVLPSLEIDRLH